MDIEKLQFTKMQGAGNDFVVLDNRQYQFRLKKLIELAPRLCNRKFGVGADGVLVLGSPQIDGLDYTMIYRNADGSDAGMCGNGARCLAMFASKYGFEHNLTFNVHNVIYRAKVRSNDEVEVTFPIKPKIKEIELNEQSLYEVHTGTEHVVKRVTRKDTLRQEDQLRKEGRLFRRHDHFQPLGTNVNFMLGSGEKELTVQTYERGVEDLTLACGTGAIASALVWHHIQNDKRESKSEYSVNAKGGKLSVEFSYNPSTRTYSDIKLKGKVSFVFSGEFYL
ncbi:MAG: diaminopimelate epimerase [Balneolaceae bacterium]|nr:diaminopimelate epimerase [Balneolaceae bacterium]